jgi:hypothetical protein
MSKTPVPVPLGELVVECRRCDARASIRAGKEYLCTRCALETGTGGDETLVVCDLCARESLVRLGEQFLCASCALSVLRDDVSEVDASAGAPSAEPLVDLLSGGEESVLAHGLEIGTLVRDGTVRLVDAAAAHHQVLARSLRRARDRDECIRRVEAAAVLFNVWAFSFDARLEELQRRNEALARKGEPAGSDA